MNVDTPDTLNVPPTSNFAPGIADPIPTVSVAPSEKIRYSSFNP